MRIRRLVPDRWLAALLIVACGGVATAPADEAHPQLARLGKVEFKVECNAAAQQEFNRAMALYHSFAWTAATASFAAVLKADPSCGMAHWGRAMVLLDNPFTWPSNLPPKTLNDISAALEAARAAGLNSPREKEYVEAVAAFVADHDKLNHRTRVQSFEEAMARLAARHPDDTEASVLSALVTSANFNPADKTYANQLKAARILDPLFAARPDHPGVAHYLIHSYDYPPIAQHGLEAAKRYADIAPDAPHALHMPSHIFTRLGHWQDSVESNRASAKTASNVLYRVHAYDYMTYAHLQQVQDKAAQKVIADTSQIPASAAASDPSFGVAYALAAMPARYALERGAWKEAAALALHPAPEAYPWSRFPQAEAVHVFARGVGAARSGEAAAARDLHARLLALRDATKEAKVPYWVEQIEIQAELVRGVGLCAEAKTAECIEVLKQAAQREDATEKHVVTPGPIVPARELLAEMLLNVANRPDDALREYAAVLVKEPHRYRALAGAMQSAGKAGDHEKARALAIQLVKQAGAADSERDSLNQARQLASQN